MNSYSRMAVILITIIFSLISLIHLYWALGGELWYDEVLPTNSMGTKTLNPTSAEALIVSIGLVVMALVVLGTQGLFDKYVDSKYFRYGVLLISLIFLLRAIGDFKFVGFFKTVRETQFGINDTLFFSPLCLFIGLVTFFIFVSGRGGRRSEV